MTQTNLYASADYAETLLVARRGKNLLVVLLVIVLLLQLALFFVERYSAALHNVRGPFLEYIIGLTDFVGLILPILLAVVLFCLVQTLLAGRLIGSGPMMSAFLWSLLLVLLLFPWQSFLNDPGSPANANVSQLGMKVPGVLYTWPEFANPQLGARFPTNQQAAGFTDSGRFYSYLVLRWARFVGFPILALLILLIVQGRSQRGLRLALGNESGIISPIQPIGNL